MNCLASPTNDPVSGFFHWGRRYFDTTNSHFFIIDGNVDSELLGEALRKAVCEFGLLGDTRHNYAGITQDASSPVLDESMHSGAMCFSDAVLRRTLMRHVAVHPTSASHPVRLQLIRSADSQRCCLHLLISHEVADVKSGHIFMARFMAIYATLRDSSSARHAGAGFPVCSLADSRPEWFARRALLHRRSRAYVDIARRMLSVDRSCLRGSTSASGGNDFFHQVLPEDLQQGLRIAARRHGVTLNTLFSGALVRYLDRHQGHSGRSVTYSFALSLRKLLGSEHAEAFRSYMVPCTVRLSPPASSRALLQDLGRQTGYLRTDGLALELGRMENAVGLYRDGLPGFVVRWVMKRTQGTNIFFSNPGVIEEDFSCFGTKSLPITDSLTVGCLVHPYDLMFYTSTFGGKTQLDVVFRSSCFGDIEKDFVTPLIAELRKIIDSHD
ncbi:MAG: hypothetical protein RBS05_16750 [Zoogloea oleivorans]|jgi:hypothetical protein|uniref:hypothetical protein n=1 Tax=Zoogloea oleivorans TaxID=1552750 RepID=UPI002A3660FE|nr:hypothetical protein [Zoogloea oleivorans]MDY0037562.1 hypothetical protein [Zoogloea oleivorans]